MRYNLLFSLFFLFLSICFIACGDRSTSSSEHAKTRQSEVRATEDIGIEELASKIIQILDSGDLKALASYISPEKGLLFSPYAYLDSSAVLLSKDSFLTSLKSGKIYLWGYTDGEGKRIKLSIREYFKNYVYDAKYIEADTISYNGFVGTGNSINNIKKVFPEAEFVEYHFTGSEKYAGMDWKSLIMIFEREKDQLFLSAIVHNEWTI